MSDVKTEDTKVVESAKTEDAIMSMDDILDAKDVRYAAVHVPEWKGTVRFGSLSAGDMIDFIEANDGPAKRTANLRLIIKSLVDKDGHRIGSDKNLEGLKRRDAAVTNRLVDKILELNDLTPEARKKLGNESGGAT